MARQRLRDRLFGTSASVHSITAAATILDPADDNEPGRRRKPLDWQRRAWDFFDQLGEVRFASEFVGGAMARLRLYPAMRPDPNEAPVGISPDGNDDGLQLTPEERQAAHATLNRLLGPATGENEIQRALGSNLFVAGDCSLVGVERPDATEEWDVLSIDELVIPGPEGRGYGRLRAPGSPPEQLPVDDTFVSRIYRRHPRFSDWPSSSLQAGLELCEELLLLTWAIRAAAESRIPAKAWLIPNEASLGTADVTEDDSDGEAAEDKFSRDLMKHLGEPVKNPKSAARLVPFIVRMDRDDIAAQELVDFARETEAGAQREERLELIQRLATTVDLPAEVLTGKADLNHWTAWQVDDDTWKNHLEPSAQVMVGGVTSGYYRHHLSLMGVESPGRFLVWYDESELVGNPDEKDDVRNAYDRFEASGDALRRASNIPDTDKPSDEEIEKRIRISVAKRGTTPGSSSETGDRPGSNDVSPGAPVTDDESDAEDSSARVAASVARAEALRAVPVPGLRSLAASVGSTSIGVRFAQMERGLRVRIMQAADAEMRRALERAGSRLRSLALRGGQEMKRLVTDTSTFDVASTLGPPLVAALGTTSDDLLAGAFDGLRPRYLGWVERTQEEAVDAVRADAPDADPALFDAYTSRAEEDREEGWSFLAAALVALAAQRLYTPTIEPPPEGEFDDSTLVDPGTIRESLVIAGGGNPDPTSAGLFEPPAGGVLSASRMMELLRGAAFNFGRYRWVYGDPSTRTTPFERHRNLDGIEFESWDDEILVNPYPWPPGGRYMPGDHAWCQCDYERVIERPTQIAASGVPSPPEEES